MPPPPFYNLSLRHCSLRKKQATLKYGDLIYANKKSLSILLNCSSRTRFARLVQSELCVTFPRSIGFDDVTTASLPSETDIYELPLARSCFLVSTLTRLPTEECITKSFWDNSFFQSYSKRVTKTNSFSQSSQRVMTEGFLKPYAKTAFFKAILKFCTANQLFKKFCLSVL